MEHIFYKKARAKDFAAHARATGYQATIHENKDREGYTVYVYRK